MIFRTSSRAQARGLRRAAPWRRLVGILATLGVAATLLTAVSTPASAVTGKDFAAGEIISDVVMYDKTTMTASGIQAFLVAKGGTCKSGYTCLANYSQTTSNYTVPTTGGYTQGVCAPYVGAKSESAATIIYKVAQYCGVNPQAILVILQKEESLVTGTAPTSLTYRKAMGYGCPDSASCSANFYGFFKQVYWGARAMARPVGNYKPGAKSNIHYSTKASCGTKAVTVVNKATSNLYSYTPYVPNRAALSNLKGSGDSCSSYGNRNFWYYFNSWFGSTVLPQSDISFVQASYQDLLGVAATTSQQFNGAHVLIKHPTRSDFAMTLITSTSFRTTLIDDDYTAIFGLAPTSAKLSEYVNEVKKGTMKQDDIVPYLLSTQTYYTKVGAKRAVFVPAVYQFLLGRTPTDVELTAGEATLKKHSREYYVRTLWDSTEYDTIVTNANYQKYLQRVPTAAELTAMLTFMKTNTKARAIAKVLNKQDYLNAAIIRYPAGS